MVYLPDGIPALEMLRNENIEVGVYSDLVGKSYLNVALLNLMPTKVETERDIARAMSNCSQDIKLTLVNIHGHKPKNTPEEHIRMYYIDSDTMLSGNYDGLIITGAPVELIDFEEVRYWRELTKVIDWSKVHVKSTLYICWAAQAGLYYNYGINKHVLPHKMFGVFPHVKVSDSHQITRGFDDIVNIPHSRHTEIYGSDIKANKNLEIVLESEQAGPYMIISKDNREIYVTGHIEYSRNTLDKEYRRDVNKGLDISIPFNYYKDNNPDNLPVVTWRAHSILLFSNWINYYM